MCNDAIDGVTVLSSTAAKICLNGVCHNGYVIQAAPTIFCDKSRQLIVEYILFIWNSAGAWTHRAQLPLTTIPMLHNRMTPSLSLKFIAESQLEGA